MTAGIRAMDEWLAAVRADTSSRPLAQKVLAAKDKAGVKERCVAANGVDVPLSVCDATVDPTIFSSPRIEAGGGDPLVGFTDDRLDCQTVPLESYDYAGRSFPDLFTPAQQETLRKTYPTGVCDYSRPGKGFQAATTWLSYQDAQGRVVYGGRALGAAPVSVPFRSAGAATSAVGPRRALGALPATGAVPLLALGGLVLVGSVACLRRAGA